MHILSLRLKSIKAGIVISICINLLYIVHKAKPILPTSAFVKIVTKNLKLLEISI